MIACIVNIRIGQIEQKGNVCNQVLEKNVDDGSDLAPNVWLHSSVGRASHRYRGGHGFYSH